MGLDAVEFVMEVEEEFGISIDEDEVVEFRTLGQVHDYLLEKCEGRQKPAYSTRSAFYRLRRALVVVLDIEPRSIRPSTPLLPLLGPWRRHRKWTRLQRELDLHLPPMENRAGAGVFWGMLLVATGGLLVVTALTHDLFFAIGAGMMGLTFGALLGYIVGAFWTPTLSPAYRTVGGLARELVLLNDREFRTSQEPSTENDPTWERLCNVLVRQLGVRRETLSRETRFTEDLGF